MGRRNTVALVVWRKQIDPNAPEFRPIPNQCMT
jgi:hypothetical protein